MCLLRGSLSATGVLAWSDGQNGGIRFDTPIDLAAWAPATTRGQRDVDRMVAQSRGQVAPLRQKGAPNRPAMTCAPISSPASPRRSASPRARSNCLAPGWPRTRGSLRATAPIAGRRRYRPGARPFGAAARQRCSGDIIADTRDGDCAAGWNARRRSAEVDVPEVDVGEEDAARLASLGPVDPGRHVAVARDAQADLLADQDGLADIECS